MADDDDLVGTAEWLGARRRPPDAHRAASVSAEVYEYLESRQLTGETHNDTLARLLGVPAPLSRRRRVAMRSEGLEG